MNKWQQYSEKGLNLQYNANWIFINKLTSPKREKKEEDISCQNVLTGEKWSVIFPVGARLASN